DALRLREINLVIEEGAPGELSRLCRARAQRKAALEQQLQHHGSPVTVQLQHVLPGIRVRRREIQRDALINCRAPRVIESAQRGAARGKGFADEGCNEYIKPRTGNAYHTDSAAPGGRRNGGDDVALGHPNAAKRLLPAVT